MAIVIIHVVVAVLFLWLLALGLTAKLMRVRVEAIVLLGIIVGLVWISIPSDLFPPNVTRMRVSRIRTDMRAVAAALESYFVDHGRYPATCPLSLYAEDRRGLSKWHADVMPTVEGGRHPGPAGLSTPVAYLTAFPPDPFATQSGCMPFAYDCTDTNWILLSPGPDRVYDVVPEKLHRILRGVPGTTMTRLLRLTYDPTNGEISPGDVWMVKQ